MKRAKRSFSYTERYAVWHCYEKRCWHCNEPLRLVETTVDHVLPESLLDDEMKLTQLLHQYGLPQDFNINGYENWLPCCHRCNQKKGNKPPAFIPGNKLIFDTLQRKAYEAERLALSVSLNAHKDEVFKTIFAALEGQTISLRDLDALLEAFIDDPTKAGLPDNYTLLDSGYWVREDQIAREDECRCERNACVGRSGKVYCYFPSSLSPWVITSGLYWRCYDEIISCPRCSGQHKRGHIGRENVCGQPYRNQKTQSD
jgi:hypothetical protein